VKEDKKIIAAIQNGDKGAYLDVLYKTTFAKIKNYIKKNGGDNEEVEDIFQDAVIIFVQKVRDKSFNEENDIDGFIYTVSRNLWINRTKIKGRSVLQDQIADFEESKPDHLNYLISDEKTNIVHQILSKLGESCHNLLTLTLLKEFSLKEVAQEMGYSSEGIAKTYSYRCRQKLISMVQENPSVLHYFQR
jgi:RNA polymerase sigma factor (sigma-70 family)